MITEDAQSLVSLIRKQFGLPDLVLYLATRTALSGVTSDPPEAVVSKVRPDHAVADVRTEVCALGSFFSSSEAAADWLAHYPQGKVVPITDDFEVSRQAMIELNWAAPGNGTMA